MLTKTQATTANHSMPEIVEQQEDCVGAYRFVRTRGSLLTPQRIMELQDSDRFLNLITDTWFYRQSGYVRFWTDARGVTLKGYYRINRGKNPFTFSFISASMNEDVERIPFSEKVFFDKGENPAIVDLWRNPNRGGMLTISGSAHAGIKAPVLVFDPFPNRDQDKSDSRVDGIIIPQPRFNAARAAYRTHKENMHPELAAALRIMLEE